MPQIVESVRFQAYSQMRFKCVTIYDSVVKMYCCKNNTALILIHKMELKADSC